MADISRAATRIAAGNLSERIHTDESAGELSELARVLNDTFARLEAVFAEQARFTSDAAHELRTPVSVILAQTQLALSRPRSATDYVETIETVQRSAQRMQGLMESLLTLACLDAHSEPLQRQPCDLAVLAAEHLDAIRPLALERGIPLHSELASTVCAVDLDRIGQILDNLLTNAVKYSRPGDEVRLATRLENGSAIVRVSDSGPGIATEHLPHLFERFYRADRSRNRSTGGAGLGLAICKSLAEAHGGSIQVESERGKGTAFTLRIPVGVTR
ncbi:MAG: ATP-binding protein [Chthoniobacteraceae bacterium]